MNRGWIIGVLVGGAACVVDPFGSTTRHLRDARDAARNDEFATAADELREADRLAEDDPQLQRDVKLASVAVERIQVERQAKALVVAPSREVLDAAWSLRQRNAAVGGADAIDATLAEKMRFSLGLLLDAAEAALDKRDPGIGRDQLVGVGGYPGVDEAVALRPRLAAMAARAATPHAQRARELSAFPLAARGHLGLAAGYVGGSLSPADELVAGTRVHVAVATSGVPACNATLAAIASRFARPGDGRRIDIELQLATCREAEEKPVTEPETVTWTERIAYSRSVTRTVQDCTQSTTQNVSSPSCQLVPQPGGVSGMSCTSGITYRPTTICTPRTVTEDVLEFRDESHSGVREVTRTTANVAVDGTYVVRRAGQPDRRGVLRANIGRVGLAYTAVGLVPAKERERASTLPIMLDEARSELAVQLAREVEAVLEGDRAHVRAELARAVASNERDREEALQFELILLGDKSAGVLATRYGVTVDQVRTAFAQSSFPGWVASVPFERSLPSANKVPDLTDADRKQVALRRRTGLPPPLVARGWFTFGVGGFSTDSASPPGDPDTELLGYTGMAATLRVGASVLGRLQKNKLGFVIADDVAARIDLGYPLSRGEEQYDGGTALRVGADYTLAVGARAHRRGGLLVGIRASASYDALEGEGTASLPLFGRVEIPLPAGSLCVEGYGAAVAGDPLVGGALYLTGETLRRGDTSSQFFVIRGERSELSRTATFTNAAFEDMSVTFADVPTTQITVELGAAF